MSFKHLAIAVWALTSFDLRAGTGIKNGGTAFDCPGAGIVMAESVLAARQETLPAVEDREEFFRTVAGALPDPEFVAVLRARWDAYGDSDLWPVEDPAERNVYWYSPDFRLERFDANASIAARDPSNEICSFPPYEPEKCCPRVLVSYFDASSERPTKVAAHFARLSRTQKNVLELHEALYRAARDLGRTAPAASNPYIAREIEDYLRSEGVTGELPSFPVVRLGTTLLVRDRPESALRYHFGAFWQWAHAIYGDRAP